MGPNQTFGLYSYKHLWIKGMYFHLLHNYLHYGISPLSPLSPSIYLSFRKMNGATLLFIIQCQTVSFNRMQGIKHNIRVMLFTQKMYTNRIQNIKYLKTLS